MKASPSDISGGDPDRFQKAGRVRDAQAYDIQSGSVID